MKKRHIVAALVVVALVGIAGVTYRWTVTPHGRLDSRAALSLNLLTFEYTFRPDPDHAIPARVYWPESAPSDDTRLPVIAYYHGGGFVTGSVTS